jgi:hypothetical protein
MQKKTKEVEDDSITMRNESLTTFGSIGHPLREPRWKLTALGFVRFIPNPWGLKGIGVD